MTYSLNKFYRIKGKPSRFATVDEAQASHGDLADHFQGMVVIEEWQEKPPVVADVVSDNFSLVEMLDDGAYGKFYESDDFEEEYCDWWPEAESDLHQVVSKAIEQFLNEKGVKPNILPAEKIGQQVFSFNFRDEPWRHWFEEPEIEIFHLGKSKADGQVKNIGFTFSYGTFQVFESDAGSPTYGNWYHSDGSGRFPAEDIDDSSGVGFLNAALAAVQERGHDPDEAIFKEMLTDAIKKYEAKAQSELEVAA